MKDISLVSEREEGLLPEELLGALKASLEGRSLRRVLILPPDFTRFHSNAGFLTNACYRLLTEQGIEVDVMPALGTHVTMTEEQWSRMSAAYEFQPDTKTMKFQQADKFYKKYRD